MFGLCFSFIVTYLTQVLLHCCCLAMLALMALLKTTMMASPSSMPFAHISILAAIPFAPHAFISLDA